MAVPPRQFIVLFCPRLQFCDDFKKTHLLSYQLLYVPIQP